MLLFCTLYYTAALKDLFQPQNAKLALIPPSRVDSTYPQWSFFDRSLRQHDPSETVTVQSEIQIDPLVLFQSLTKGLM